jgi:hypothetical protein
MISTLDISLYVDEVTPHASKRDLDSVAPSREDARATALSRRLRQVEIGVLVPVGNGF